MKIQIVQIKKAKAMEKRASNLSQMLLQVFLVFTLLASASLAQDRYIPYKNSGLWSSDTLYLGASFVKRTPNEVDPVVVWLRNNEAGWTGKLYVINPRTGAAVELFTNKDTKNVKIDLAQQKGLDIRVGDTIYFRYDVQPDGNSISERNQSTQPKFTGANDNPSGPYYSLATAPSTFKNQNIPKLDYGHKWSVAGRVNTTIVEFGFEDNVTSGSDMDFDDVVFQVTGLLLNIEKPRVATPYAVPAATSFASSITVELKTNTPGAKIYYTVNGSNPTTSSSLYSSPLELTTTTTIKAFAVLNGFVDSDTASFTFSKSASKSTLEILDGNGNPSSEGFLSEKDNNFTVRIRTAEAGLSNLSASATTKTANDQESVTLSSSVKDGDFLVYSATKSLSTPSTGTKNNNTVNGAVYDNLIVTWTNPRNSSDVAADTISVRPSRKNADAWFSTTAGGAEVNNISGSPSTIYIVVKDQAGDPARASSYRATIISTSTTHINDTLSVNLVEGPSGTFVGTIPVDNTGANVSKLYVKLGDLLHGIFVDPIDGDNAAADAGYGASPTITGELVFLDSKGNVIPNGTRIEPSTTSLKLRYVDDYFASLSSKTVTVVAVSTNASGNKTTDNLSGTLTRVSNDAYKATYEGTITMSDTPFIKDNNAILEIYYDAIVTANVAEHTETGASANKTAEASLRVAAGDKEAVINLTDTKRSDDSITRGSTNLKLTIVDQNPSSHKPDTLIASLRCKGSGDVLDEVILVEGEDGVFVSTVTKNEDAANSGDRVLSCKIEDEIEVTYRDPHSLEVTTKLYPFKDPTALNVYFTLPGSDIPISEIREGKNDSFQVVVTTVSKTASLKDELSVKLTNRSGDVITVKAVETSELSGKFVALVPYGFIPQAVNTSNSKLESTIDAEKVNNSDIVTAQVETFYQGPKDATLVLNASYVKVSEAYIIDGNNDGQADSVFLQFAQKLPRLPSEVSEAWWNRVGADEYKRNAPFAQLSFGTSNGVVDSSIVVLNFKANPYKAGLTHIPPGEKPYAQLPSDALFGGQKPAIQDKIGPIVVEATLHYGGDTTVLVNDQQIIAPDTVILKLSEVISTSKSEAEKPWNKLVRYAPNPSQKACSELYSTSSVVGTKDGVKYREIDSVTFAIVLNSAVGVGDCIYLNSESDYTDLAENAPGKKGEAIKGEGQVKKIRDLVGFPPVVGFSPGQASQAWRLATSSDNATFNRDYGKGQTSSPTGSDKVEWLPPLGFTADFVSSGKQYSKKDYPATFDENGNATCQQTDAADWESFPIDKCLASIVVTSSPATRYDAKVYIYDNLGNFVTSFEQTFGYCGELGNVNHFAELGRLNFIPWNLRDKKGQQVGQGVYIWKVVFQYQSGTPNTQIVRTGNMRVSDCN